MRYLIWYLDGQLAVGNDPQKTYWLDDDYHVKRTWIISKRVLSGSGKLSYDIKVDGNSIFTLAPSLIAGTSEAEEEGVFSNDVALTKDSFITCHITEVPGGETGSNVTIGLDLEAM